MQIDYNTLEKLEKLSHLRVEEEKRKEILEQLSEILKYVDNLNELDTDRLDSYFSTLDGGTPMREDVVSSNLEVSKSILKNAPKSQDDFFVVPAIIE